MTEVWLCYDKNVCFILISSVYRMIGTSFQDYLNKCQCFSTIVDKITCEFLSINHTPIKITY